MIVKKTDIEHPRGFRETVKWKKRGTPDGEERLRRPQRHELDVEGGGDEHPKLDTSRLAALPDCLLLRNSLNAREPEILKRTRGIPERQGIARRRTQSTVDS